MIRLGEADAHSYFQYLVNSVEDKLNPVSGSCSCKHYVKLKFFRVLLFCWCHYTCQIARCTCFHLKLLGCHSYVHKIIVLKKDLLYKFCWLTFHLKLLVSISCAFSFYFKSIRVIFLISVTYFLFSFECPDVLHQPVIAKEEAVLEEADYMFSCCEALDSSIYSFLFQSISAAECLNT